MATTGIGAAVRETLVRSHCEDGSQQHRNMSDAERNRARDKRISLENKLCSAWFAGGVAEWGKQSSYADEIGVTESVLSEMMSGKRVVQLRHVLPILLNPSSAKPFIGWQCEVAEFAAPRRIRKLTRAEVEAKALDVVRKYGLWKLLKHEVAGELGSDEDMIELALLPDDIAK